MNTFSKIYSLVFLVNRMLSYKKKDKTDLPIAKLGDKLVYYNDVHNPTGEGEILTSDTEERFQPLPRILTNQRNAVFISAPSGSGKSWFTANYVKELRKLKGRGKKKVYLFSASQDEDPAYKDIPKFLKIDLYNPRLGEIDVNIFKDSIVVYDDWDSHPNSQVVTFLFKFLKALLERGRKLNIDVVSIVHDTLQGAKTKPIIFESTNYVLFPRASYSTTSKFLKAYMGFSSDEVKALRKLDTRTVYISKQAPQYIISDKEIRLL